MNNFFKGAFWISIGTLLSKLFVSLAYLFVARILSPTEFGKFSLLKSNIDSFLNFSSAGLNTALIKYINQYDKNKSFLGIILGSVLIIQFFLATVILMIFFSSSKFIAINIIGDASYTYGLRISSIGLFFTSINLGLVGFYSGFKKFRKLALVNIITGTLYLFFIVIGVYFKNYIGGIYGIIFAQFVSLLLNFFFIKKDLGQETIKLDFYKIRLLLKPIINFVFPLFVSALLTGPTIYVLNLMLLNKPNNEIELATFNVFNLIPSFLLILIGLSANTFISFFSSKYVKLTEIEERFKYFAPLGISLFFVLIFIYVHEISTIIIGEDYKIMDEKLTIIFNFLSILIISHRQGFSIDLIKSGKTTISIYSMGQWSICTLILFYFVFSKTASGLASAIFLGYFINTLIFVPIFVFRGVSPKFVLNDKNVIIVYISIFIFIFIGYFDWHFLIRIFILFFSIAWFTVFFSKIFNYDIYKALLDSKKKKIVQEVKGNR